MRRSNTEKIGDLVMQVLRVEGIETPLNEYRAVEEFKHRMAGLDHYISNIYIKNRVMHVHLTSPALKSNLSMCLTNLTQEINLRVNAYVIDAISLH